ncbi:hypothetical protein DPEC_G00165120 [Dallia pectoralis]|uniref:Uncharacterized protein n=2 Tax=Dallia pectoralis TaxID=75939 RepID=A0ACC2GH15_DALPE|nr:hypothetical protein DPEC_G00164820 [Dallia pectoralis]KAJ8003029.1 hypothetical protein DPEC_G00165120 [Dallia pectoralis]
MGQVQSRNGNKRQPEHLEEEVKPQKKKTHPIVAGFQFLLMLSCCGVCCNVIDDDYSSNSTNPPVPEEGGSQTPVMKISITPQLSPLRRFIRPNSYPSYCPRGSSSQFTSMRSLPDLRDYSGDVMDWWELPGVASCSGDKRDETDAENDSWSRSSFSSSSS